MTVTVYTTPSCTQCTATKRRLTEKGVDFVLVDLAEHPNKAAEFREAGILQAPVVVVEGRESWWGFQPDRIDALALAAAA